jgi:hypothetical protein
MERCGYVAATLMQPESNGEWDGASSSGLSAHIAATPKRLRSGHSTTNTGRLRKKVCAESALEESSAGDELQLEDADGEWAQPPVRIPATDVSTKRPREDDDNLPPTVAEQLRQIEQLHHMEENAAENDDMDMDEDENAEQSDGEGVAPMQLDKD